LDCDKKANDVQMSTEDAPLDMGYYSRYQQRILLLISTGDTPLESDVNRGYSS